MSKFSVIPAVHVPDVKAFLRSTADAGSKAVKALTSSSREARFAKTHLKPSMQKVSGEEFLKAIPESDRARIEDISGKLQLEIGFIEVERTGSKGNYHYDVKDEMGMQAVKQIYMPRFPEWEGIKEQAILEKIYNRQEKGVGTDGRCFTVYASAVLPKEMREEISRLQAEEDRINKREPGDPEAEQNKYPVLEGRHPLLFVQGGVFNGTEEKNAVYGYAEYFGSKHKRSRVFPVLEALVTVMENKVADSTGKTRGGRVLEAEGIGALLDPFTVGRLGSVYKSCYAIMGQKTVRDGDKTREMLSPFHMQPNLLEVEKGEPRPIPVPFHIVLKLADPDQPLEVTKAELKAMFCGKEHSYDAYFRDYPGLSKEDIEIASKQREQMIDEFCDKVRLIALSDLKEMPSEIEIALDHAHIAESIWQNGGYEFEGALKPGEDSAAPDFKDKNVREALFEQARPQFLAALQSNLDHVNSELQRIESSLASIKQEKSAMSETASMRAQVPGLGLPTYLSHRNGWKKLDKEDKALRGEQKMLSNMARQFTDVIGRLKDVDVGSRAAYIAEDHEQPARSAPADSIGRDIHDLLH